MLTVYEKIHSIWSENELRDVYNTMDRIVYMIVEIQYMDIYK